MTDTQLRRIASLVRSYLPELVGADAQSYDRELALLLNTPDQDGSGTDDALIAVLTRAPELHRWVAAVLESPHLLPPELRELAERGGYEELTGPGEPVDFEVYTCPQGDFVWYRVSLSAPVPRCTTEGHTAPLVAA